MPLDRIGKKLETLMQVSPIVMWWRVLVPRPHKRDKVAVALAKELPPGCELTKLCWASSARRSTERASAVDDKASLDALRDRVVLETEDDSLENAINKTLQTTAGERAAPIAGRSSKATSRP